jgi:hypothetical protein
MEQLIAEVAADPPDVDRIQTLERLATLVMPLPMGLNLWKVQNTYWQLLRETAPAFQERANKGEETAMAWLKAFASLGHQLQFVFAELTPQKLAQAA